MNFPLESLAQMEGFFWVLMRVSIIIFLLPIFGATGVPALWKAGLSMMVAIVLLPVVPQGVGYPETPVAIVIAFLSEAIMGFILAITVRMYFEVVQMAGNFMSFQMGFSMATVIDPQSGMQNPVLSQFLYIMAILIFFSLDGHHIFLRALAGSFQLVPPSCVTFDSTITGNIVKISSQMWLLGIKLSAPIIIALFLSNLCLGIVARTVPQINILMVGFPVNICIGLIFLMILVANITPFLSQMFNEMGEALIALIRLM